MLRICNINYSEGDFVVQSGLSTSPADFKESLKAGNTGSLPEVPEGYFDDGDVNHTLDNTEVPLEYQPNVDMNDLYKAQEEARERLRNEKLSRKEAARVERELAKLESELKEQEEKTE